MGGEALNHLGRWCLRACCLAGFVFLIVPILVIVPLSFNAEPYFTFTEGMLRLDPDAWSLRWYRNLADAAWTRAFLNSLGIGIASTSAATILGTLAAVGLANPRMPGRAAITALVISPMVTPVIIVAVGLFFLYSGLGLVQTYTGLILAHTVLGAPLVVITVTASLAAFDWTLIHAAASLGAGPVRCFFRVMLPTAGPGIASGSIFAFVASFDEIAVMLFIGGLRHRTIPREMWSGIREQASPTLLAVATLLIAFALLMLLAIEWLQRRAAPLRDS